MDFDDFDLPHLGRSVFDPECRELMPWTAQTELEKIINGARVGELGGVVFDLRHPGLPSADHWHSTNGAIPWGIAYPWDRAMYDGDEDAAGVWVTEAGANGPITHVFPGDKVRVRSVDRFYRGGGTPPFVEEHDAFEFWAYLEVERADGTLAHPEEAIAFCARDAFAAYSPHLEKDDEGYDLFLRNHGITFEKLSRRIDRHRAKQPQRRDEWLDLAYLAADLTADEREHLDDLGLTDDGRPLNFAVLVDAAVAAGYALAKAEAIGLEELAKRGLNAQRGQRAGANGSRKRADPVRALAREVIREHPNITQTRCAMRVAAAMGRDQRSIERLIEEYFEWREFPGGIREKRPRPGSSREPSGHGAEG